MFLGILNALSNSSAFVKHQCTVLNTRIIATDMGKYYLCENGILNNNFLYHSFYGCYTFACLCMVSFPCDVQTDCQFGQLLECWLQTEVLGKNSIRKKQQIQTLPPQKRQAEAFLCSTSKLNSNNYCSKQKFQLI